MNYTVDVVGLVIAAVVIIGTWRLFGYRLTQVEKRQDSHGVTTEKQAGVQASHTVAIETMAAAIKTLVEGLRDMRAEGKAELHEVWEELKHLRRILEDLMSKK